MICFAWTSIGSSSGQQRDGPPAARHCCQVSPHAPAPSPRGPRNGLAEVRHERGRRWAKWFRISSGYCRVCTTFVLQSKMFGQADSELPEQRLLLGCWLGDPPQPDLAAIGSGQNDVGAPTPSSSRTARGGARIAARPPRNWVAEALDVGNAPRSHWQCVPGRLSERVHLPF